MSNSQVTSLEQSIAEKLSEVLNRDVKISNDTDLRNEGLDSLKTIELIVGLEVVFEIEIDDQDLLVENFSTINRIASLLAEKYGIRK